MNIEALYAIYLKFPRICTDTRKIEVNSIFFALKGETFNGNEYAEKALTSGAVYAVVDEEKYIKDERYLLVDDVLKCLQQLAKFHRKKWGKPLIAVAGSNGKTTTKELIYSTLSTEKNVACTQGNFNNHIGVPLTILNINAQHEMAIIEIGANHKGENLFLCEIAAPDYVIVTNCGKDHLEGFGSLEGVIEANSEVYLYALENNSIAFVNADDPTLMENSSSIPKRILYSSGLNVLADFCIQANQLRPEITFEFNQIIVHSCLSGDYNFDNILAAFSIAKTFNISDQSLAQGIINYKPSNMRSQRFETASNRIFLDAYNANPSSMELALRNIAAEDIHALCILGDMFELGAYAKQEHMHIVELCSNELALKNVILCGENFKNVDQNIYPSFLNVNEVKAFLENHKPMNKLIFIKGSRGMKLEQIVDCL